MTNVEPETTGLQGRVYDSLIAFNKEADWPELRLAQIRQHLAEHLSADIYPYLRRQALNEAVEAARGEQFQKYTGTEVDEAYSQGVSDVIAAIERLFGDQK